MSSHHAADYAACPKEQAAFLCLQAGHARHAEACGLRFFKKL
ncbi:hypothetical protein AmDm5_0234 [Acetobacter malorum]|nr:hypothetical protein AmDm5_0234 [Acetobacter malorum]